MLSSKPKQKGRSATTPSTRHTSREAMSEISICINEQKSKFANFTDDVKNSPCWTLADGDGVPFNYNLRWPLKDGDKGDLHTFDVALKKLEEHWEKDKAKKGEPSVYLRDIVCLKDGVTIMDTVENEEQEKSANFAKTAKLDFDEPFKEFAWDALRRGRKILPLNEHKEPYNSFLWKKGDVVTTDNFHSVFAGAHGWGIIAGQASGIIGIDLDTYNNSDLVNIFAELEERYEWDTNTFTIKTVRGGYHLYFYCGDKHVPKKLHIQNIRGFDIIGDDGYFVGQGSVALIKGTHVHGTYIVENDAAIKPLSPMMYEIFTELVPIFDKEPPKNEQKIHSLKEAYNGDDDILKRMFNSPSGEKIKQLYQGNWQECAYTSQSEADMALCGHLARFSQKDALRMDTLFRSSGLMRKEWDDPCSATESYGQRTINRAIEGCVDISNEDSTPQEPIPLHGNSTVKRVPYPVHCFGGTFSRAITAIQKHVQAPTELIASSILGTLSLCTQHIANVTPPDGRVIPLSLNLLSVASSGERKSQIDSIALLSVGRKEEKDQAQYRLAHDAYKKELRSWEKQLAKGETDKEQPQAPKIPKMTVENVTSEGLFRLLAEGRGTLGVFSDEAAGFFGNHQLKKESEQLAFLGFITKLWDGKPVDKLRSGEGYNFLNNRRCCINLMAQPEVALPALSNRLFHGQGFWARFLLGWPQSTQGQRFGYSSDNIKAHPDVQNFYRTCDELLAKPIKPYKLDGIAFDAITLTPDALNAYIIYKDEVEKELSDVGKYAHVRAFASKSAEQALRIAGVLCLAKDSFSTLIDTETMQNAIELARWYLDETTRIMEESTISPEIMKAEQLLKWLYSKKCEVVSKTYIAQNAPKEFREAKVRNATCKTLQEHGWLVPMGTEWKVIYK